MFGALRTGRGDHDHVFASLLPGFRELRTPLAAGYLYLLSLFLFVADHIPTKSEVQAPLDRLYDIASSSNSDMSLRWPRAKTHSC
ncbi:hypothetical protein SBI_01268 [Streptomyces bingchenggensis BCW-1]|uniref:Uncharacterized protein n=1 Tax=Streptomyces bingchenggensis (strain BCW-1) TaxID=749414 RepID=D7CA61_STRBB|nr:hypothetical protein SBI_01268 [Streptomyces bingchenggensis BCW-1]